MMISQGNLLLFMLSFLAQFELRIQHNIRGNIAIISPVRDKIITSHLLAEFKRIHTASRCLDLCTYEDSCLSFFHHPGEQLCHINSVAFHTSNSFWETKNGTLFYVRIFFGVCGSLDYTYHPPSNICYRYYSRLKVNQTSALAHCLREEAQLMSLDTMDKFLHIRDFLSTLKDLSSAQRRVLVGAVKEEGQWSWVNGSPLSNTSAIWAPQYPRDDDKYLYGRLKSGLGFYMITSHFSSTVRLICERVPKYKPAKIHCD